MRQIVIASHGFYAEGLLSAVTMIAGKQEQIQAYGLSNYESPQDISDIIEKQIMEKLEDEWIILCDITGGSVHNQLTKLCRYENVYVVGGCMLSMVLELAFAADDQQTADVVNTIIQSAKDTISYLDHSTAIKLIQTEEMEDELW